MLRADWNTIRLALHIFAAAVWVGGQVIMAGLVPAVRALGPDERKAVTNRFNVIAFAALVLALFTGIWNVFHVGMADLPTEYHITLGLKMVVVVLSGFGAAAHAFGRSKALMITGAAVGLIGGIAAVIIGVMLRGG